MQGSAVIPVARELVNKGAGKAQSATNIGNKIQKQMGRRGWTPESIKDTVNKPYTAREAANRATGNKATAYFNKDGSYVVRDNITGDIIQISNRYDLNWVPDATIKNPYLP